MRRILAAALTGFLTAVAIAAPPAARAAAAAPAAPPKAPPPPPAGWTVLFADDGATTDWAGLYRTWGTDGRHVVQNTPDGLRVAGGGTPGNDDQRVALWIGARLKGPDFILEYAVRRNDRGCPLGTATMLLLSAAGNGKGARPLPPDPASINIPAPSLDLVGTGLDALRLSTMAAYNRNPALNAQLRLRQLPGAAELGPGSANVFPFARGRWNAVRVAKQGSTVSVDVTPQGQPRKGKAWTSPVIVSRKGPALGWYLQECGDITLKDVRLLGRK